jgi:PPOX class probable F420-dependent enzyme
LEPSLTNRTVWVRLRKDLVRLLERERVCRVATADRSGRPHVVPVCHVWVGGKLYFATEGTSRKVRNLLQNPRVCVVVDVYTEDWSRLVGVLVEGTARVVRSGPLFRRVRALLYRKYPQYPEDAAVEPRGSVVVEVTPRRVSSWGFD